MSARSTDDLPRPTVTPENIQRVMTGHDPSRFRDDQGNLPAGHRERQNEFYREKAGWNIKDFWVVEASEPRLQQLVNRQRQGKPPGWVHTRDGSVISCHASWVVRG